MTTPHRRVLRPTLETPVAARRTQQLNKRQTQLEKERVTLDHWMTRLKRAFNAVIKQQRRIARIERHLRLLEQA